MIISLTNNKMSVLLGPREQLNRRQQNLEKLSGRKKERESEGETKKERKRGQRVREN